MLVQHFGVVTRVFFRGKGVHVAADAVEAVGNILGRMARGSLEQHVLDKMGNTVHFRGFVTRSGSHPDAEGDGPASRNRLNQNAQSAWQNIFVHPDYPLIKNVQKMTPLYQNPTPATTK